MKCKFCQGELVYRSRGPNVVFEEIRWYNITSGLDCPKGPFRYQPDEATVAAERKRAKGIVKTLEKLSNFPTFKLHQPDYPDLGEVQQQLTRLVSDNG